MSGKESAIPLRRSVKFSVLFCGFPPAGIVNAAWGNCQLRVRRWPSPRAAFESPTRADAVCPVFCDNFCKVFLLECPQSNIPHLGPRPLASSQGGEHLSRRGGEHCLPAPLPFCEGEGRSEARGGVGMPAEFTGHHYSLSNVCRWGC